MAKIDSVSDNFNDNSLNAAHTKFEYDATISEVNGQIEMLQTAANASGHLNLFDSNETVSYDITNSSVYCELKQNVDTGGDYDGIIFVVYNVAGGAGYGFVVENGYLEGIHYASGSASHYTTLTAYNTTNHRWLKIEETGGQVNLYVSANGTTWNLFEANLNIYSANKTAIIPYFGMFAENSGTQKAIFDNFNTTGAIATKRLLSLTGVGK